MKLLTTSTDRHLVQDLVADAVIAYAVAVIQRGGVEAITVPTAHGGGRGSVQILVSAATQLSASTTDAAEVEASDLDEAAVAAFSAQTASVILTEGQGGIPDGSASFVDFGQYDPPPAT